MSDTRKDRYIRDDMHAKLASHIKNEQTIGKVPRIDKNIMKLGETWYNIGHTLEEAETELQQDYNFVQGYQRAARIDSINDDLYKLGMEYFKNGTPLVNVPANFAKSEYFIRGYNEALRLSVMSRRNR